MTKYPFASVRVPCVRAKRTAERKKERKKELMTEQLGTGEEVRWGGVGWGYWWVGAGGRGGGFSQEAVCHTN